MQNSFISNYINEDIRKRCEESGHVCPFWPNRQIVEDLLYLDNKDGGNRFETYWLQCHSPYFVYRHNDFHVFCKRNNISLGNYYGEDCKYCNKEVAEQIKGEIYKEK